MKVKDIMIKEVFVIDDRKPISLALALMHEKGIRRLPVLADGKLVGIIVQHDIEKAYNRPGVIAETPVDWIMTKHPITVSPEDDLIVAARIMITNKICGLPVMEGNKLVGIVSEIDILKILVDVLEKGESR
ncbi:MAG: CBS domain-containing protein [Syntrophomonadaceae bacterium]|nr:CBS domain-containing protein [Syntrophomonadaceae bacterium]